MHQVAELLVFPLPLYFCSFFYPEMSVSVSGKGQGFNTAVSCGLPGVCAKDIFGPDVGGRVGRSPIAQELNPAQDQEAALANS